MKLTDGRSVLFSVLYVCERAYVRACVRECDARVCVCVCVCVCAVSYTHLTLPTIRRVFI